MALFYSTCALVVASLVDVAFANCAYGTSLFPRLDEVPVSNFSYNGLSGPLNWYGLNKTANYMCDKGSRQSPIVINSTERTVPGSSVEWKVPDYPHGAAFENLGTNVEIFVNGSLHDTISDTYYKLAQFHFHLPGEHRVDSEFSFMEMHWVFESEEKQYAVIAFLINICESDGCGYPLLETIFKSVNKIATPGQSTTTAPLRFSDIIKLFNSKDTWRYSGSISTPPCTQEVDWHISQHFLPLSLATWYEVRKVVKFNARYTQDWLGDVNLLENAAEELTA